MAVNWQRIYQRSFYNLQVPNRQHIDIIHPITSPYIAVELSKLGGWDYRFIGYIAPFTYIPGTSTPDRVYGKWQRAYIGRQMFELSGFERLGNIEFIPKLWIPDISITVWLAIGDTTTIEEIEQKLDTLI
ncbi:hypothetical protein [Nostoc sp. CMAA1605]|uniref:hypothetical protein n=1 Tax=Nostoc sp. CMAA1605 TaxID=2055159 RepID=UPI001F2AFFE9|nr:hypothetical protein [Nostoc sp. CMAA1605]MCF4968699.1 hypothetical protein [Nostoc sp. CMAA1605]